MSSLVLLRSLVGRRRQPHHRHTATAIGALFDSLSAQRQSMPNTSRLLCTKRPPPPVPTPTIAPAAQQQLDQAFRNKTPATLLSALPPSSSSCNKPPQYSHDKCKPKTTSTDPPASSTTASDDTTTASPAQPPPPPSSSSSSSSAPPSAAAADTAYTARQLYLFGRYIDYVKNYDEVLAKKFPAAMKVYRVFAVGIKDFFHDMKRFLKITRIHNASTLGLRALTRSELELYYQMPRDMLRVAPVLALSALPLANYVVFPVAYMYPKLLLSPHFWSAQQRHQFDAEILGARLAHQKPVLRFLQDRLKVLRGDEAAYFRMRHVLGRLGSGQHATVDEVHGLTDILSQWPYALDSLPRNVLSQLCGLHGIHRGLRKRSRLAYHAFVVHHMDVAIRREGGVHNMPVDGLLRACHIRGLNTANLSHAAMVEWLRQWVELSVPVTGESISVFLFLPIFIAYNHPNNWQLLYTK